MARTSNPIKSPLLALPYGKPPLPSKSLKLLTYVQVIVLICGLKLFTEEKMNIYGTRYQEAVKIFNALLAQESLADPIKQVQEVMQKCFDIEDLQSEVRKRKFSGGIAGRKSSFNSEWFSQFNSFKMVLFVFSLSACWCFIV